MKYFIDETAHWDVEGYWNQFRFLKERLSKPAYNFFLKHSFHDASVMSIALINTPIRGIKGKKNVNIEASLIDYFDENEYIIKWKNVVKFKCDYNMNSNIVQNNWLEQWAYDELTILNDKYLSHEILLKSGVILLIYFKYLEVKRCNGL